MSRPALIDDESYDKLHELRRFRHLFRAAYGIELDPERGELEISTREPQAVYRGLPGIALDGGVSVQEMSSQDDNLEAVFRYLVH